MGNESNGENGKDGKSEHDEHKHKQEHHKKEFFLKRGPLRRGDVLLVSGHVILTAVIATLLFIFGYGVREVFSPILVFVMLLVILIPSWRFSWAKAIIFIISALFFIWVFSHAANVLYPFIISAVLAYVLHPLVKKVEENPRISHIGAVVIVTIPILLLIILATTFISIGLYREVRTFTSSISVSSSDYNSSQDEDGANYKLPADTTSGAQSNVAEKGDESEKKRDIILFENEEQRISLKEDFREKLAGVEHYFQTRFNLNVNFMTDAMDELFDEMLIGGSNFLRNTFRSLPDFQTGLRFGVQGINLVWTILWNLLLTPVLTIYLLMDFHNIRYKTALLIPKRYESEIKNFISAADKLINSYLRGMLLLTVIYTIIFYAALKAAGVKYALILALVRGVFNLVPFIGVTIAFLIAIPVGTFSDPIWWQGLLKIILIYGVGQFIDTGILAPRVLGSRLKMHPVIVILSVILCGYFFNFVGILIAVPFAGVVSLLLRKIRASYFLSAYYNTPGKK